MQNTVKIKALSSWEEFSNHFHIDVSKLQEASDGDSSFLNNKKLARMDQKDIRFMNDQGAHNRATMILSLYDTFLNTFYCWFELQNGLNLCAEKLLNELVMQMP